MIVLEEQRKNSLHCLTYEQREYGKITGVKDVFSFDDEEIILMTNAGKMSIKGEKLHVRNLDLKTGNLELEGRVNHIIYSSTAINKRQTSLAKRIFR